MNSHMRWNMVVYKNVEWKSKKKKQKKKPESVTVYHSSNCLHPKNLIFVSGGIGRTLCFRCFIRKIRRRILTSTALCWTGERCQLMKEVRKRSIERVSSQIPYCRHGIDAYSLSGLSPTPPTTITWFCTFLPPTLSISTNFCHLKELQFSGKL